MADQACFSFQNQLSCEDYASPENINKKLCTWTCPRTGDTNDCKCVLAQNTDDPVVLVFSAVGAILLLVLIFISVHYCCRHKSRQEEEEKKKTEALIKRSAAGDRIAKAELDKKKWYREHSAKVASLTKPNADNVDYSAVGHGQLKHKFQVPFRRFNPHYDANRVPTPNNIDNNLQNELKPSARSNENQDDDENRNNNSSDTNNGHKTYEPPIGLPPLPHLPNTTKSPTPPHNSSSSGLGPITSPFNASTTSNCSNNNIATSAAIAEKRNSISMISSHLLRSNSFPRTNSGNESITNNNSGNDSFNLVVTNPTPRGSIVGQRIQPPSPFRPRPLDLGSFTNIVFDHSETTLPAVGDIQERQVLDTGGAVSERTRIVIPNLEDVPTPSSTNHFGGVPHPVSVAPIEKPSPTSYFAAATSSHLRNLLEKHAQSETATRSTGEIIRWVSPAGAAVPNHGTNNKSAVNIRQRSGSFFSAQQHEMKTITQDEKTNNNNQSDSKLKFQQRSPKKNVNDANYLNTNISVSSSSNASGDKVNNKLSFGTTSSSSSRASTPPGLSPMSALQHRGKKNEEQRKNMLGEARRNNNNNSNNDDDDASVSRNGISRGRLRSSTFPQAAESSLTPNRFHSPIPYHLL